VLETIFDRRSIRKFKDIPVEQDKLKTLVRAGFYAPSGRGLLPWHFVVIDERALLDQIAGCNPNMPMAKTAAAGIVVCADTQVSPDWWQADCAAAAENILLAAKELGLGTCWCAIQPNPTRMANFEELLHYPQGIVPFCFIAVGYPDEEKETPDRVKDERVHINRW
jgi:nitroreductase